VLRANDLVVDVAAELCRVAADGGGVDNEPRVVPVALDVFGVGDLDAAGVGLGGDQVVGDAPAVDCGDRACAVNGMAPIIAVVRVSARRAMWSSCARMAACEAMRVRGAASPSKSVKLRPGS
jgi:hypothetical protein